MIEIKDRKCGALSISWNCIFLSFNSWICSSIVLGSLLAINIQIKFLEGFRNWQKKDPQADLTGSNTGTVNTKILTLIGLCKYIIRGVNHLYHPLFSLPEYNASLSSLLLKGHTVLLRRDITYYPSKFITTFLQRRPLQKANFKISGQVSYGNQKRHRKLLIELLPNVLDNAQKIKKVGNILYSMSSKDKVIVNRGTNR